MLSRCDRRRGTGGRGAHTPSLSPPASRAERFPKVSGGSKVEVAAFRGNVFDLRLPHTPPTPLTSGPLCMTLCYLLEKLCALFK